LSRLKGGKVAERSLEFPIAGTGPAKARLVRLSDQFAAAPAPLGVEQAHLRMPRAPSALAPGLATTAPDLGDGAHHERLLVRELGQQGGAPLLEGLEPSRAFFR